MREYFTSCVDFLPLLKIRVINFYVRIMLLRVSISNFLSFYDEITFDMFPSRQRKGLMNHVYTSEAIPVLKMGAIYGANNAGKSNFIKAIKFIRNFVLRDKFITEDFYDNLRYKLVKESNRPIKIELEFSCFGNYYVYSLSLDRKLHEKLALSGLGEKDDEIIFKRDGSVLLGENISSKDIVEDFLKKNPYSSILSLNVRFPIIHSPFVEDVYTWFNDYLEVIGIYSSVSDLIKMMSQNHTLLDFSDRMMKLLDISDSLSIKQTDLEQWLNSSRGKTFQNMPSIPDGDGELMASKNKRNEFHLISKDGKRKVLEFVFKQIGPEGKFIDMDIDTQSDGTVRLLTLLPAFYSVINKEKVVFIDEIENSMHPNMIYRLVKYFADNTSKGQLVFTTHLTRFLNQQELMRVDEMWKTEKNNGMTLLSSFNDFKIHNTINVENGYLLGRFGGVPSIDL